MVAFVLRRLAQAVLVMLTVGLIAFALFRFVGDPVVFMLGQDATQEERAQMRRELGLDRPFYIQYAGFLTRAVRGEFGLSLRQLRPVSTLIVERLPATLELSLVAALLAVGVGIPMGVYTALRTATAPAVGAGVVEGAAAVAVSFVVPLLSPPPQAPRTTALAMSASLLNRIVKASSSA